MPPKDTKGTTILTPGAHKMFTDGQGDMLLIEKDHTLRIHSDPKDEAKYGKKKSDDVLGANPHCTIFGPPVFFEGKIYFATYIRTKSLYFVADLATPSVALFMENVFEPTKNPEDTGLLPVTKQDVTYIEPFDILVG